MRTLEAGKKHIGCQEDCKRQKRHNVWPLLWVGHRKIIKFLSISQEPSHRLCPPGVLRDLKLLEIINFILHTKCPGHLQSSLPLMRLKCGSAANVEPWLVARFTETVRSLPDGLKYKTWKFQFDYLLLQLATTYKTFHYNMRLIKRKFWSIGISCHY